MRSCVLVRTLWISAAIYSVLFFQKKKEKVAVLEKRIDAPRSHEEREAGLVVGRPFENLSCFYCETRRSLAVLQLANNRVSSVPELCTAPARVYWKGDRKTRVERKTRVSKHSARRAKKTRTSLFFANSHIIISRESFYIQHVSAAKRG